MFSFGMCTALSAFVCMAINAIRNIELCLCCFKHTAIVLHITIHLKLICILLSNSRGHWCFKVNGPQTNHFSRTHSWVHLLGEVQMQVQGHLVCDGFCWKQRGRHQKWKQISQASPTKMAGQTNYIKEYSNLINETFPFLLILYTTNMMLMYRKNVSFKLITLY